MNVKELLFRLSNATGVCGYETEKIEIVAAEFGAYCDETRTDKLGNVIGLRKGRGQGRIMLTAHLDEIGLMVADIDDEGFLKLTPLGHFDQRTLLGQKVIVHASQELLGVIGTKPACLTNTKEAEKAVQLEDLSVDIGFPAVKVRELVRVGDIITINRQAAELLNDKVTGKCLDNAAGVTCLVYALECLKDVSLDVDLYVVASAQEEMGCRGALTAAYSVKPDIAVAVDVGFARTAELKEEDTSEMGKGADISCGPNISRRVFELLRETAKENHIPAQYTVLPGMSGTDAYAMQIARGGVATGCVSIPLKYMHTSVEIVSLHDIKAVGRLLAAFTHSYNGCGIEESLCL